MRHNRLHLEGMTMLYLVPWSINQVYLVHATLKLKIRVQSVYNKGSTQIKQKHNYKQD